MSVQRNALTGCFHEELLAAWKRQLSPWLAAIRYHIAFPNGRRRTPPTYPTAAPGDSVVLAERDDIAANFWLCLIPSDSASRGVWIQYLEALELLGLLATSVSKRVCWDLLFGATVFAGEIQSSGWPQHSFHDMRPRFECRFDQHSLPSDEVMALILDGIPDEDHTANYTQVRKQLVELSAFRACDEPVQLRFHFSFPGQTTDDRVTTHLHSERRIANGRHFGGPLRALKRVEALARHVAAKPPREKSTWMQVVAFGFHMHNVYVPDDAREWLRAIASHVPIFWLAYGVSSRAHGIGNFYGPFLWRLLAPHVSRRAHLGLQNLSILASSVHGANQIIALCSALAQSQTLQQLEFTDDGGDAFEADSRVWASWLVFALFSRVARHGIRSVYLNVRERVTLYATTMDAVLQHTNPVAYLAAMADGVEHVEVTSANLSPTTVRLRANRRIYGSDLPEDCAATTVYHGKQTAECHVVGASYGKFTRILIPGVGFGCVEHKDVESTQPTPRVNTHPVRSLSLRMKNMDVASVEMILRLVGEPLTTVSVRNAGRWDRCSSVDVESLLASCPRAKHVSLEHLTIQLRSLTTANWGRKIESLALRSCSVLSPTKPTCRHALEPVKSTASLEVFPQLSSLYVCTGATRHPPELQAFLLALAVARDLERFMVVSNHAEIRKRYLEHTKERAGRAIQGLLPRHKLAFLSVVSVCAENAARRGRQLDPDTITQIFELAARSTHGRISMALYHAPT